MDRAVARGEPGEVDERELKTSAPAAQRRRPGREARMHPAPVSIREGYRASARLAGKAAIISGGDSGIGRAVAIHFAHEGCDVCFLYLDEHADARETQRMVEEAGRQCLAIAGDARSEAHCRRAIEKAVRTFGRLDVVVNNMGRADPLEDFGQLERRQLLRTFETNVFPFFYLARHALPHLKRGASIINTGSVSSIYGDEDSVDYAATKGAIESFTYSLARALAPRGIRVNGVAPGPVWTPLLASSYSRKEMSGFGESTMLGRVGHPAEIAPAYVYLASDEASYVTGHLLRVDGGYTGA